MLKEKNFIVKPVTSGTIGNRNLSLVTGDLWKEDPDI